MMKRVALVIAATMGLNACGALFNGKPANVAFNSNPAGAEVWIDGTNRGITPATLQLPKNRSYTVTFRRAGYADATAQVDRKLSAGYVVLDVLGGLIPIIIDAATGSWYTLSTDSVNVQLAPSTAASGRLTPEQLAAVRMGVPFDVATAAQQ